MNEMEAYQQRQEFSFSSLSLCLCIFFLPLIDFMPDFINLINKGRHKKYPNDCFDDSERTKKAKVKKDGFWQGDINKYVCCTSIIDKYEEYIWIPIWG